VDAEIRLPGSKSLTNRYLTLAAVASDASRLRAPLRSRDTLLMAQGIQVLGARVVDESPVDRPVAARERAT
jgi:3-phosphoshikimate 1-carboxyvinyltransferase